MNTKHTPGPWTRQQQPDIDANGNGYTWAIKAQASASYAQNPAYANSEANAEFIVRACNSHEELRKLLTAVLDSIDRAHDGFVAEWTSDECELFNQARAAIVKATHS